MNPTSLFPPPRRVLWELTWKCDLRCAHCLVNGGHSNTGELDTSQALELVERIARLGPKTISLTGGEPLLRKDCFEIARAIRSHGIGLRFSSNGHLLTEKIVQQLHDVQTENFTVSIDGVESTHNRLRPFALQQGEKNSYQRVVRAIDLLREGGIATHVITSVSQQNLAELASIHEMLKEKRVARWILQLVHPTGRAVHNTSLQVCQPISPSQLKQVGDFIVSHATDPVLPPTAFNSIGYLNRTEPIIRSSGKLARHPIWQGCQCGRDVMGIEPNGDMKGCANQVGAPFVVGNGLREEPFEIWNDRGRWHWLNPQPADFSGACAACALAHICRAGCTAVAYQTTGELFNNPYCLRQIEKCGTAPNKGTL